MKEQTPPNNLHGDKKWQRQYFKRENARIQIKLAIEKAKNLLREASHFSERDLLLYLNLEFSHLNPFQRQVVAEVAMFQVEEETKENKEFFGIKGEWFLGGFLILYLVIALILKLAI